MLTSLFWMCTSWMLGQIVYLHIVDGYFVLLLMLKSSMFLTCSISLYCRQFHELGTYFLLHSYYLQTTFCWLCILLMLCITHNKDILWECLNYLCSSCMFSIYRQTVSESDWMEYEFLLFIKKKVLFITFIL